MQETPDGCLKYCQYDSSRLSEFVDCLGPGIIQVACQGVKTSMMSTGPTIGPVINPTKTQPAASPTYTGFAPRKHGWSKFGVILAVMTFVGLSFGRNIKSCSDGQCEHCDIGNSGSPDGKSSWSIEYPWPHCDVYTSASFQGAQSGRGGGCEFCS